MTGTIKQFKWICNLYEEFGSKLGPLSLCVNNQDTIFLASNSAQERPYEIRSDDEHFIRDLVEFWKDQTLQTFLISISLISWQANI